jgi:hypothetical protein
MSPKYDSISSRPLGPAPNRAGEAFRTIQGPPQGPVPGGCQDYAGASRGGGGLHLCTGPTEGLSETLHQPVKVNATANIDPAGGLPWAVCCQEN